MIFDQSNQKESQTVEALVPMVDLFAVLAIVFMIYATDEIKITEMATANKIQEVERKIEEKIQEIADQYESDPQVVLAKEAEKTLQEVKDKRKKKAEELVLAFSAMLEAQQDQAADEYENLVAAIEQKHQEALSQEKVSLDEQKQAEIETEKQELRAQVESEKSKLKKEQEEAVEKVRKEAQREIFEKEIDLQVEKMVALAEQEETFESQLEAELAQAEAKHDRELARTETILEAEKRQELEFAAQAERDALAEQEATLAAQAAEKLRQVQAEAAQALAQAEAESEADKQQALEQAARAESERLAAQADAYAAQSAEELRQTEAEFDRALARTEAILEAQKTRELERAADAQEAVLAERQAALDAQAAEESRQAEAEAAQQLAQREAELDARKHQELAREAQAQEAELAVAKAALESQKAEELQQAEAEHARELAQAEADAEAERLQALADAAEAEQDALDQLQANLAKEKEDALAESEKEFARELDRQQELTAKAVEELSPYRKADEAKQQIVDLLNENFKDYDASAIEIDDKTGKVRLNFQQSYFVRGSHELSQEMKDFLRIVIPKYAKSIYENKNAAQLVESLKISGMTSPIYMGKYIDINDASPRSERARQYNMALSNRRAVAMYNFIFDASEMGTYPYRTRLKRDMGISALGFQNAQPVRQNLVGKEALCIEYNCMKEQATILQFQLYTEEFITVDDSF